MVNVQGDEPLIEPELDRGGRRRLLDKLDRTRRSPPPAMPIHDAHALANPNVVKVVMDARGYALYFSALDEFPYPDAEVARRAATGTPASTPTASVS